MILTRGPDDVCLGDWFILTEEKVERLPHLTAVEKRTQQMARLGKLERDPLRSFFVHWSLLTDAERNRIFAQAA